MSCEECVYLRVNTHMTKLHVCDEIFAGYAPTTTYNNDRQPTKEISKQRVSDDVFFTHIYTTTSAKGSLRPGTYYWIEGIQYALFFLLVLVCQ